MDRSDFLRLATAGLTSPSLMGFLPGQKKKLIKPKRLQKGDTIGFAAPAGIVYEDSEFDRMKEVMESFGFEVVFGENVKKRFGYFAGTDVQRAEDLNRFFKDPEIDGIIAVRGGWGCARIIEHLDFEAIRKNPKVYCGFSDNTSLHLALQEYSGLVTFHGPVGTSEWTDFTKHSFKSVLMKGDEALYKTDGEVQTIFEGSVEGHLMGGNLSILVTSLGTPYQPDAKNALLFTEDIGEDPYRIDRMMTHLKHAGILEEINGFIFGKCTDCEESLSENDFTIREILDHHIKPLHIPAVMGVNIGHEPGNFTIPLGIDAKMDASTGSFQLTESAVV